MVQKVLESNIPRFKIRCLPQVFAPHEMYHFNIKGIGTMVSNYWIQMLILYTHHMCRKKTERKCKKWEQWFCLSGWINIVTLTYSRHSAKHFTLITSFNPHDYLVRWAILSPCYTWENWRSEQLRNLPRSHDTIWQHWDSNPGFLERVVFIFFHMFCCVCALQFL